MLRSQRFENLQVLRAAAALLVVTGHALYELKYLPGAERLGWDSAIRYGAGVDLFFVISGFIMIHISANRRGPRAARQFIVSRILRIVPIYWFLTALWIGFALAEQKVHLIRAVDIRAVLDSFLFLPVPDLQNQSVLPLLYPGWSLNYEMFFYGLFGLALLVQGRRGVFLLLAVLLSLFLADAIWNPRGAVLGFFVNNIVVEFAFGMVIALLVPAIARLPATTGALLLASGLILFVGVHFSSRYLPSFVYGGFGALIVAGAVCLDLRGRSTKIRSLIAIGDASYSLYLCHLFVVQGSRIAIVALGLTVSPIAFVALAVCLFVGLGVLVHRAIERPLQQWSHRYRLGRSNGVVSRTQPVPES